MSETEFVRGALALPADDAFEEMADGSRAPFLASTAIEYAADVLIGRYEELAFLSGHRVRYLWRREARRKRGIYTLGYCYLNSPELRWLTETEATIVLVAGSMRALALDVEQVEATLYHELCHLGETETGKLGTRDHDCYLFYSEVQRYGLYLPKLRRVGEAVEQLRLV